MERIIQYVKDRTKLFDNYIPCMKSKCDNEHVLMLMKSIAKQTLINKKIKLRIHRNNTKIEVTEHA